MGAVAVLGRPGPRVLRDHCIEVTTPQVRHVNCRSAFHDSNATPDRETMGRAGPTAGPEAIGDGSGPAASIILGQTETARMPSRPSSSQYSAGS